MVEAGGAVASAPVRPSSSLERLSRAFVVSHVAAFLAKLGRSEPLGMESEISEAGLGLDSLQRLDLLAGLTARFELQRTGVEDYMLVRPRIADWVELLSYHIETLGAGAGIVFETSGTTQEPRAVRHALSDLEAEVDGQVATVLGQPPRRIVAMVPGQHIYGCLFTVILPAKLGIPVLDLSSASPSRVAREGGAGDLIVGTPTTWDILLRSVPQLPEGMRGVVSAAPAPRSLWPRVAAAGLECLVELYGSTETAGVGFRTAAETPFALLPGLSFGDPDGVQVRGADGRILPVQDILARRGPTAFDVLGRADGMVQVGGVNVSPRDTAARLSAISGVAEAAVRLDRGRLQAFVVPSSAAEPQEALAQRIRTALARDLPAVARPETLSFGAVLPRDAMGKLRPWGLPGA